jgi:hypothetical protein
MIKITMKYNNSLDLDSNLSRETIKLKLGPNSTRNEMLEKCQKITKTLNEELHQNQCKQNYRNQYENNEMKCFEFMDWLSLIS